MRADVLASAASIASVLDGERTIQVAWTDGRTSAFHHLWLRDNCPQRRHAETNHRVEETSALPADVRPTSIDVTPDGSLRVVWSDDGHESVYAPEWLARHDYSAGVRRTRHEPRLWDAATIREAMPRASYPALVDDAAVRRAFMSGFRDYGVGILDDVPTVPGTVLEVGALLGEVRVTSWGRLFDVISMENANSVAYTSLPLVTHTDEGYRNPAPTIQLQHFLVTEAEGGEATLVDGFRVAHDLRAEHPEMYDLLASVSLHFHFRDATAEHEHDGTILDVEPGGRLRAVRYSNHSVQPFLIDPDLMDRFYDAYRTFGTMRESATYKIELPMASGQMYLVDNHRVLHGRTGYRRGGNRHLQSCYIERDEFMSRLAVLERGA